MISLNQMQDKIKNLIKESLKNLGMPDADSRPDEHLFGRVVVEHPDDLGHGDYSTNVAMVCAKKLKTNPRELAEKIKSELEKDLLEEIEKMEVAGAGFINFHMSRKFYCGNVEEILNNLDFGRNSSHKGKKVMIEYTDPNPFKPFHIGHLMSNAIGESISRLIEFSGAEVTRVNYQGDVGLHIAKSIHGLLKNQNLRDQSGDFATQASRIGEAYVYGSGAYEDDAEAKKEINAINKKIYSREDDDINMIYDWGLKVTMNAFEDLYRELGTKFDYYFLESRVAPIGADIVRENTGKVFEDSDGAVVFRAEEHDPKLHTRVFLTSEGLPSYEGKELGLALEKFKTVPDLNLTLIVTANEQADYMSVVVKALSLIHPEYTDKMKHITHGMMRLAGGKMGSRKGNVITGETLLKDTKALVVEKMQDRDFTDEERGKIISGVAVAAIKYSILRQGIGGDIIFDFEQSISFEGDSGPYLQYSYARAKSVLRKAQEENILPDPHPEVAPEEVSELEKILYRFPEVVERAGAEYGPHYVTNYLTELAQSYNSYYGSNLIVDKGDKTSPYKVALTYAFTFVMKRGLHLLGIQAPERM
jgi:arginyl-tRNA synthetase